jgi:hypothetical protein
MNANPKVRRGKLIVYVKYHTSLEGRNNRPSTISVVCQLSEAQNNVNNIVNAWGAQYYTKVTFNGRPILN